MGHPWVLLVLPGVVGCLYGAPMGANGCLWVLVSLYGAPMGACEPLWGTPGCSRGSPGRLGASMGHPWVLMVLLRVPMGGCEPLWGTHGC